MSSGDGLLLKGDRPSGESRGALLGLESGAQDTHIGPRHTRVGSGEGRPGTQLSTPCPLGVRGRAGVLTRSPGCELVSLCVSHQLSVHCSLSVGIRFVVVRFNQTRWNPEPNGVINVGEDAGSDDCGAQDGGGGGGCSHSATRAASRQAVVE